MVTAAVFLLVARRGRRVGGWLLQSVLFSLAGLSADTYVGFLAAMAGAGTILVWGVLNAAWRQAYVDELTELAWSRVTRSLTDDECQQYLHLDSCPAEMEG